MEMPETVEKLRNSENSLRQFISENK